MGTKPRTYKVDDESIEWLDDLKDIDGVDKSFVVRRALKFYREKVIQGKLVDKKYEARKDG